MKPMWSPKPRGRASAGFLELLRKIDPDVQCERRFDWLFLPKEHERLPIETQIYSALREHCRSSRHKWEKKASVDPDTLLSDKSMIRRIEFDFYLPSLNLAVEFDERQHFTEERAVTLAFRNGHTFEERWLSLCSDKIIDTDPADRDWKRAYRDAVRDVRAKENNVNFTRICHKNREWSIETCEAADAVERLRQALAI